MHVLTQKRFEGLEEDKIAGGSKRPRLSYYPERIGKQKSLITREYKLVLTMSRSKYFNRNILRL